MNNTETLIVRVLTNRDHMPLTAGEIACGEYTASMIRRTLRRMVADGTVFCNEGCGPRGADVYGLTAWKDVAP